MDSMMLGKRKTHSQLSSSWTIWIITMILFFTVILILKLSDFHTQFIEMSTFKRIPFWKETIEENVSNLTRRKARKFIKQFHVCVKNIHFSLESDVKKMFIQLLETDIDSQRKDRAEGDTFCKLFEQIRSGERKISLSEREKEICWIFYGNACT